ncbi:dtw domain-containing protein 2 [Pitangus sulphuratus]|nr:dtw domain-containing protein 2 [Pitangus sulphuratus]
MTAVLQLRNMGFQEEQAARRGEGAGLYAREQLECMELCLGMDDKPTESSQVKISEQTTIGVCYRPPHQEDVAKAFLKQLEKSSGSQALIFMEHFNHPDICWKGNTAKAITQAIHKFFQVH